MTGLTHIEAVFIETDPFVYVTSRGVSSDVITSGIAVLANDPACK